MGYETILTPVLLMIGFGPHQVVPAVLVSQLAGDFLARASRGANEDGYLCKGEISFSFIAVLNCIPLHIEDGHHLGNRDHKDIFCCFQHRLQPCHVL